MMTSQAIEEAWIRTGGCGQLVGGSWAARGRLVGEWVNTENNNSEVNTIIGLVQLSNKRLPQISAALEA